MKRQLRINAFLALPALFILAGTSHGQVAPNPSHTYNPDEAPPKDISKLLDMRRGDRFAGFDTDLFRKIIGQLPRNVDSKQFNEETIRKLLENNPDLRDPKKLARLTELVEQFVHDPQQLSEMLPQLKGMIPNATGRGFDLKEVQKALQSLKQYQQKAAADPKITDPALSSTPAPKTESSTKDKPLSDKTDKQADQLTRWLSRNFGDSPTMSNIAKDLAGVMMKEGKKTNLLSDVEREWKEFVSRAGPRFSPPNFNGFGSDFNLPDLKPSSSFSAMPSIPSDIGPTAGSSNLGAGGGDNDSFILLGLLAAAVLGYLLIRRRQASEQTSRHEEQAPALTAEIRSRADVISAFECLSIAKCGADAVNWHHHRIADAIGNHQADSREPAARLAELYEKARYAPLTDPFTETEIADARRRLNQLAGVAPA